MKGAHQQRCTARWDLPIASDIICTAGTKQALDDQLRLGQELRRKVERVDDACGKADGDSSGSSTEASDDEAEGEAPNVTSKRAARQMREGALDILKGRCS